MNLKDWMLTYLKSRDAIKQEITGIEDAGDSFIVRKQNADTLFLVRPELNSIEELNQKASGAISLAVHNTKHNINFVIANWDALSKFEKLCIYFVNPSSNEKWMLYPHTHNQITEKAALRKGLESMHSEIATYAG